MKKYEITYLTRDEEGHDAKAIASTLSEHNATIVSVHPWGARRKLVYPIKKTDQAFYTTVVFEAETTTVKPIETALSLNNDVLRSLLVSYQPGVFDRTSATSEEVSSPKSSETEEKTVAVVESVSDQTKPVETEKPVAEEKPKRTTKRTSKKTEEESASLDEKLDALLNEDITK